MKWAELRPDGANLNRDPRGDGGGNNGGPRKGGLERKDCPFCDEEVSRLPDHLPKCPKK